MPQAAPKPCRFGRCTALVRDGTSRCAEHKQPLVDRFSDLRRGSRHERRYGSDWDRLRIVVLKRDAGICQPCLADGRVHQGNEVDHRIGKAQWKREHGTSMVWTTRPKKICEMALPGAFSSARRLRGTSWSALLEISPVAIPVRRQRAHRPG
jgi:5-methylcytosine-specific restriction protein A